MPVSPTDFYAYAQATGTEIPKSRQEQAEIAPAVFKWRKAQLQNRNPEDSGALSKIAGGIGALGLGAAGVYGARRGLQALRNRPITGIAGIQETAAEAAPAIRKVTTGIETGKTTPTVAIPQQAVKIEPLTEAAEDIALVSERPVSKTFAQNPLGDYLAENNYVDTSVAVQNAKQPLVSDQSVTAVNSSSNQILKEFKSDVQTDIDSIANKPLVVQEKLYTAEDLMASSLPQEEIATRISAAAKDWGGTEEMGAYGEIIRTPDIKVPQLLLNPNTPESVIHEYLGTTPQNLGGRQSFINPTHEVLGGGGVTERPKGVIGYVPAGKTIRHKLSPAEREELGLFSDRSAVGNRGYTGTSSDIWTDDVVAGIEGLGGPLTEVEAYQELRRKSGKTMVPGQVMADEALAEGSERLERVLDEAVPLPQYRTAEGTPTSGLIFTDETTLKPRSMQGVKLAGQTVRTPNTIAYELDAKGKPVRKEVVVERGERLQAPIEISDPNVTGNRIIGNVETQEPTRYFVLGKQPNRRTIDRSGVISSPRIGETISIDVLESGRMVPSFPTQQGKLQGIYDIDIAEEVLQPAGKYKAGEDRIAMQPYMMKKEVRGSDGQLYETSVPVYGPLMQRTFDVEGKAQLSPTSVSRYQLKQLANTASQEWDNPLVKRNWMLQNAPGETEAPYHRTTYIAQQLKAQLQKGITTTGPDVPVSRTPSQVAAKTRGTDAGPGILIAGTTQRAQGPIGPSRTVTTGQIDLPVLEDVRSGAADRFVTDLTTVTRDAQVRGRPIPTSGNVDYKKGKVLVPGATPERKGLGGLDPMQLEDASSEDFVAYQSPRVEMSSTTLQQAPADRRVGPQQTLWDIKQARQRSSPVRQDSVDTLILNQNELNTKVNQLLAQGKRRAAKGRKS